MTTLSIHVFAFLGLLLSIVLAVQHAGQYPLYLDASSLEFQTFRHDAFPDHSVRMKQVDFCDDTVRTFTGYIDVEDRHMFFYFFESRRTPEEDPVMLWLNGGPGASGTIGMLMELGPCTIASSNSTKFNPHGWNNEANLLFVDQPIGVGYSYSEYAEVENSIDAAEDVAAFLAIFLDSMEMNGRPLHLAGESYGGRYVPVLAAKVYDQNAKLKEAGRPTVNLTSALIGNGVSDWVPLFPGYYEMQCSTGSGRNPVQPIETCIRMKKSLPVCLQGLDEHCGTKFSQLQCEWAWNFCNTELLEVIFSIGGNPYDLRVKCEGELDDTLCYSQTKDINNYLNSPSVRKTIGVDESFTGNFSTLSWTVNQAFIDSGDALMKSTTYLENLLDRGVKILIYVGNQDLICNWVGNLNMAENLEFGSGASFKEQDLKPWQYNGEEAGLTKSYGGLTFASVYEAGHMVPLDQPEVSLAMVNRWMSGVPL